jgi:hypothetical protein
MAVRHYISLCFLPTLALAQLPEPRREPPPEVREQLRQFGRGEGKLKPGDLAEDFSLKVARGDEKITLSRFRGVRPVALVFGSYT